MKHKALCFLMLITFSTAHARQEDPGLPGGDPDVPLDGGLGILLLAGAAYGVKKLKEKNDPSGS